MHSSRGAAALLFVALLTGARCGDGPPDSASADSAIATPAAAAPADTPAAESLNVVLLVMDTTRADRLSVNGYDRPTTPNLEELAKESVVYRNAWIPAGWTGPSHASLFTGQRPVNHGFLEQRLPLLPSSALTLAEIMTQAGWATAALSNNILVSADFGLVQGFGLAPRLGVMKERPLPHSRDAHDRALEFIDRQRDQKKPFFVFINDYEPHLPYEPDPAFQDRFLRGTPSDRVLSDARSWNNPIVIAQMLGLMPMDDELLAVLPDLYDAEIAWLDHEIGAFVKSLRARGLLERTLLIVTADHGDNLGEHGLWDHRFSIHKTIRHVPLIIRFPDGYGAGTVVDDVVRTEDVMPTILEVCGQPLPPNLDGESLLAPTAGRISRASYGPQISVLPHLRELFPDADDTIFKLSQEAVFDGRHHLIVRSDGYVELFDHETDPDETTNVAADHPDVVARLKSLLDNALIR